MLHVLKIKYLQHEVTFGYLFLVNLTRGHTVQYHLNAHVKLVLLR